MEYKDKANMRNKCEKIEGAKNEPKYFVRRELERTLTHSTEMSGNFFRSCLLALEKMSPLDFNVIVGGPLLQNH